VICECRVGDCGANGTSGECCGWCPSALSADTNAYVAAEIRHLLRRAPKVPTDGPTPVIPIDKLK
jgi:hypothetical protein